eukprot:CAMPEP_0206143006 /NCGR_PEP_ID=MMETSP1473-20131121/19018_1 /ASSEMBLY_ACC=CAM_ASM_001109 /TAXON_ID=1461547 /ORGANISM="Stichococcus sp, Strain RCC1054" /LENGTH=191 /DNA_ID=CAMNT_0053538229 /DNA_START=132 /DNA_END=704 /DNA_ORIENTATION=+
MVRGRDEAPRDLGGLLQWSIANAGSRGGNGEAAPPMAPSEEDRAWFQEAMNSQLNVAHRMREIKGWLEQEGAESAPTLEDKEQLLDELLDIVEDIDHARDLRPIGGLPTLLHLLEGEQPSLRAGAASVIGAAAQNNEPVQQWLLEGGALPPLVEQLSDDNAAARVAAFTAVSCLVRKYPPGREALVEGPGL